MSTDTWISPHCELSHLVDMTPSSSSSSSSPSLYNNVNMMQQFSNVFSKFHSSETNSCIISTKSKDPYLYNNYLSQTLMNQCITTNEHQIQDHNNSNLQLFQEFFHKFLKTLPQFDMLQKSFNNYELSSDRSIQDLTMNRGSGQCELNISDFNCSNTTLGTLPSSPLEKSSPHDSSLGYSQHFSTDNNKSHTENQPLKKYQISSEMNGFCCNSDHIKMNKTSNLYTTLPNESILNSRYSVSGNIRQDYGSPNEKLTSHIPDQCRHCSEHTHEQSTDEHHAINLSMKNGNFFKTIPTAQSEKTDHHNTEMNDASLSNPAVYEYYHKLIQLNYFEWFRYLLYQSSQITGNSSTSSPIPHLFHNNHIHYQNNNKSCDVNSLNNINSSFRISHYSKDTENTNKFGCYHSSESVSNNSDIRGSNYSYDLSNLPGHIQSNFSVNNYQTMLLNRLSTITSTTPPLQSYSPVQMTHAGLHSITKDTSKLVNVCNIKAKSYSVNPTISKCTNTKNIDRTTILNGSNSYACKLCSKVYTQASALKMHVRTHTLPCRCTHCGKSFSRKWLLKGHERTHTGERPYSCTVCSRSFADRSNLRAHMQTHQREKRYSCPHCPRSFSRMGLLNKHMLQCSQTTESNHRTNNRKTNTNTIRTHNSYLPIKFA
ncbi:unnamed protein product [Schistosoma turkestanicum]|nr:unnamed protein product [Schistosoma turkestanicum]